MGTREAPLYVLRPIHASHHGMAVLERVKAKVLVVGGRSTEKTAWIAPHADQYSFVGAALGLGAHVYTKTQKVLAPDQEHEVEVLLQLWDIASEDVRASLYERHFFAAQSVLVVCDAARRDGLEEARDWIRRVFGVTGRIPVFILVNTKGGPRHGVIEEAAAAETANACGGLYAYTSGDDGTGESIAGRRPPSSKDFVRERERQLREWEREVGALEEELGGKRQKAKGMVGWTGRVRDWFAALLEAERIEETLGRARAEVADYRAALGREDAPHADAVVEQALQTFAERIVAAGERRAAEDRCGCVAGLGAKRPLDAHRGFGAREDLHRLLLGRITELPLFL